VLLLEWDTVEDHTVGFRGSASFAKWRATVGGFFAQPPFTEHFEAIPPQPLPDGDAGPTTAAHDGTMDKPIRDFSDCHAGIVSMLDDLASLAHPAASTPQRRDTAGRVLAVFRDVVTTHHQEEEAELFPAVLADAVAGDEHARAESLVSRLVGEHRRVEGIYAE
jgi:hypothetical protein